MVVINRTGDSDDSCNSQGGDATLMVTIVWIPLFL